MCVQSIGGWEHVGVGRNVSGVKMASWGHLGGQNRFGGSVIQWWICCFGYNEVLIKRRVLS